MTDDDIWHLIATTHNEALHRGVLNIWTVYDHPADFPHSYVARRFEVDGNGPVATQSVIVMPNLDDLRDVLAFQLHLVCLTRNEEDDPKIVETWL